MERGLLIRIQYILFPKHQLLTRKLCNQKSVPLRTITNNSSTQNSNMHCWKCGIKKSNNTVIFCEKCRTIQSPVDKNNYFKVMGIDENYNIDMKKLKEKFRKFQSLIHPDRFSNSTHEEKTISEEYSSLINKSYSNLMSPMKRAEHLLQLKGETIGDSQTINDPGFMMQIMTLNEEVEDAKQDIEKLKKLDEENKNKIEKLVKEIDYHFRYLDIDAAKKTIIELKYFTSINDRINSILREAGITD